MLEDDRAPARLAQLCSMRVERAAGLVLMRLQGEFDLACVEPFEAELTAAIEGEAGTLVLDLSGVRFIDSTGLQMLVTLKATTSEAGLGYAVLCGGGGVRRVLRETGLDGVLPLASDASAVPASDSPI